MCCLLLKARGAARDNGGDDCGSTVRWLVVAAQLRVAHLLAESLHLAVVLHLVCLTVGPAHLEALQRGGGVVEHLVSPRTHKPASTGASPPRCQGSAGALLGAAARSVKPLTVSYRPESEEPHTWQPGPREGLAA